MTGFLLELQGLRREYPAGDQSIAALKHIDLAIAAGEMVAIVGASGSGKSTLMNILGCLDRPTAGTYLVSGRATSTLAADELARLRREHFGFVFQRYHLLPDLTALANVEIPAIYAGTGQQARHRRAISLLDRLGLGERVGHLPGQLSGGQQQRVSIARALMNGGQVILADEPTGALDSQSGLEMMKLLGELHAEGHTVIIVTHDMRVAEHADRIIEISDGEIVADRTRGEAASTTEVRPGKVEPPRTKSRQRQAWRAGWGQLSEAARMALRSMASHRLRTFLTMLGIIIGIASVVSVVALGEGSRQRILKDINSMGTNTIDIFPGKDFGDEKAQKIQTLVPADAEALGRQAYVDSVTPIVSTTLTLRFRNISATASINGVSDQYFRVRGYEVATGSAFDADGIKRRSQQVVIDENTRKTLFGTNPDPVGEIILIGSVPCRVLGVTKKKDTPFGSSDTLNVWVPYTTAMGRLLGQTYLKGITVRVSDAVSPKSAEQDILKLLARRHRARDVFVMNTDTIRQTIEKTTATMTLLVSMIAFISLLVGGIGVMNIMLVSVTERTAEIGVRMAVGARQGDIMRQFMIEAVLVCLIGGLLGIGLALSLGFVFPRLGGGFSLVFSPAAITAAFACSTLIGIVFGFLPARNAARLDPVEALARE